MPEMGIAENLIYYCVDPSDMVFESLIQQSIDPAAFPVWIPLTFGLAVGLGYVIVSAMRRKR
jgi:hypothetical protein